MIHINSSTKVTKIQYTQLYVMMKSCAVEHIHTSAHQPINYSISAVVTDRARQAENPSRPNRIRATHTVPYPIAWVSVNFSLKTTTPQRNCKVGEMYCKIPISESGICCAAVANISNGNVVITPAPIKSKSFTQPVRRNAPFPALSARKRYTIAGTTRMIVSSINPKSDPSGAIFLTRP